VEIEKLKELPKPDVPQIQSDLLTDDVSDLLPDQNVFELVIESAKLEARCSFTPAMHRKPASPSPATGMGWRAGVHLMCCDTSPLVASTDMRVRRRTTWSRT